MEELTLGTPEHSNEMACLNLLLKLETEDVRFLV